MQQAGPGRRQLGLEGQVCPLATRRTTLLTGSESSLSPLAEGTQQNKQNNYVLTFNKVY